MTHLPNEILLAFFVGIFGIAASSGFWAYIMSKSKKKSDKDKLLLGLGCERIVSLGMAYINRGWIYKDEYDVLIDYLWVPYNASGGDGTAERVIEGVKRLPIHSTPPHRYDHTQQE